jgi:phosphoribosylformimino-5-aminoimidazole carboxamide ribotide isomerase
MTRIIPAIDLQEGRCVRLRQGRFDSTQVFGEDPLALARAYAAQGAKRLHVVDLDAARGDGRTNRAALETLAGRLSMALQVGGGVRSDADLDALLRAGARRVVIGSLAVSEPARVAAWLDRHGPEAIVLALDVRLDAGTPTVRIHGWQTDSGVSLWDALAQFTDRGLRHLLCTDIGRDGMGEGPNVALYRQIMARFPALQLQASGGVRDRTDLAALHAAGVPFAISGRALLEGTLRLEDGL